MLKKAVVIALAAIGVVGSIILWFRNEDAVATSAARPWPGEMGTLYTVAERWPPQKANGASVKLTALAKALPKNNAIDDFVAREITRGELIIGEPPALPDVSAIRELLLREPIWRGKGTLFLDTNSHEALLRRREAATLKWRGPALMLFARAACAVGAQAGE